LPQPTPWGCAALGVVQPPGDARPWAWPNPLGAPVLVPWPYRLGGVSRHPPRTAAGPPRPRLRQWVAVSAASETACRRTPMHLPARSTTGGPAPQPRRTALSTLPPTI